MNQVWVQAGAIITQVMYQDEKGNTYIKHVITDQTSPFASVKEALKQVQRVLHVDKPAICYKNNQHAYIQGLRPSEIEGEIPGEWVITSNYDAPQQWIANLFPIKINSTIDHKKERVFDYFRKQLLMPVIYREDVKIAETVDQLLVQEQHHKVVVQLNDYKPRKFQESNNKVLFFEHAQKRSPQERGSPRALGTAIQPSPG